MAGTFPAKFAEFMVGQSPDVFIETGTYDGKGVRQALKYGFREIHTVEVSQSNFQALTKNNPEIGSDPRVIRYLGSSRLLLPAIIASVKLRNRGKNIVFWLDAHYQGLSQEERDSVSECPLMSELASILCTVWPHEHPVICIDDANMFVDELWETDKERGMFNRYDWPSTKEIMAIMKGWDHTADDNILYFYKN